MITDYDSFIAGIQVGRRLKIWEIDRSPKSPPSGKKIITQQNEPILTETGLYIESE